ncbi:MAG: tetratricopeptide repeat protein [Myxococcales bacterium]|nr:tetratricopeptide repeat protein [Myxococcales bacterium]
MPRFVCVALFCVGCLPTRVPVQPHPAVHAFERGLAEAETSDGLAEALPAFEQAAAAGGGAAASYNAGVAAERLGLVSRAERHLRHAVSLQPDHDPAREALAQLLEQLDRFEEAVPHRAHLTQRHPGDLTAHLAWVRVIGLSGQTVAAANAVREVLRQHPEHAEAYQVLAEIYAAADWPGSELVVARALQLAPNAGLHNARAMTALQAGRSVQAVAELQAALRIDAEHFAANMNLGWLAADAGDFRQALVCFERATRARPGDLSAALGLALAQRGTGDLQGAKRTYEWILVRDPAHEAARHNLGVLHQRYLVDRSGTPAPDPVRLSERRALRQLTQLVEQIATRESVDACLGQEDAASFGMLVEQARAVLDAGYADFAQDALDQLAPFVSALQRCSDTP